MLELTSLLILVGVGQTVNVNFFLATPLETSERPVNMTVVEVDPAGTVTTLGPFTGDTTGGTFYNFVPPTAGNYTFQFLYLGQVLSGTPGPNSWAGLINDPSQSEVVTLVVQQEPITYIRIFHLLRFQQVGGKPLYQQ